MSAEGARGEIEARAVAARRTSLRSLAWAVGGTLLGPVAFMSQEVLRRGNEWPGWASAVEVVLLIAAVGLWARWWIAAGAVDRTEAELRDASAP